MPTVAIVVFLFVALMLGALIGAFVEHSWHEISPPSTCGRCRFCVEGRYCGESSLTLKPNEEGVCTRHAYQTHKRPDGGTTGRSVVRLEWHGCAEGQWRVL